MNGGDANQGLTRLRRVLIVLAQAPVAPLPRIGPLHDPTHRQRLELCLPLRAAYDFQPVGPPVAGQPGVQLVVVVLGIREDDLKARKVPAAHLGEDVLGRPGVIHVGRRHDGGEQKAQGIHEDMTLAALNLFAAVDPPRLAPQRRLDRLAVDRRRAGRQRPPSLDTGQGTKDTEDLLPGAVRVPFPEVVIHAISGGEVVRQGTPGAAFPGVIEQRVDDLPQIYLTRPTGPAAARGPGEEGLNEGPLLVRNVTGIGFALHTGLYANPNCSTDSKLRIV